MNSKKILSSKFSIFGLTLLLVFLGNFKFQQWQDEKEIQKQVDSLIAQKEEREKKSQELKQTVEYFSSNAFKEKVAREQLGFKKNGETVFGFSEQNINEASSSELKKNPSNAEKWWDYFFAN